MIVFNRLWDTMQKKGVTQYKLIKDYNFSPAQITRLKRNHNINTHKMCIRDRYKPRTLYIQNKRGDH